MFVVAFVVLLLLKLTIAATLAPFGDEAFYWQESRHLAWGYSDLPPLTAWLIRLGESVAGHGVFGMRWPFLLIGSALPWLLVAFAHHVDAQGSASAASAGSAGVADAQGSTSAASAGSAGAADAQGSASAASTGSAGAADAQGGAPVVSEAVAAVAALQGLAPNTGERRTGIPAASWQAGLLCLLLPLAGSLGVLALPDVPLTVAIMLALLGLLRAMDANRSRDWLLLGAALALCWLTHYRAAMPMLAGLLLFLATPRGRAQWRRGGFWLAMLVAAIGLLPLLISNWQQHGAGVAFQLYERNPWQFHADALVQPLEQALACTPLLYVLLLWAAWRSWQLRRRAPWDLVMVVALTFLLGYFVLGLFADDLRFRAHWPLPGYLPLLAALPLLWSEFDGRRGMRGLLLASVMLAGAGQLAGMAYLGLAAYPGGARMLSGVKAFPANFVGWQESATVAARLHAQYPGVLVADNFMLAAELDFQLDAATPIYVLDSPLNAKHGRAAQLALWQRDETALRASSAGQPMLLAIEETALRERERADWLGSLCSRILDPQPLQRLDLYQGRKRIAFYLGRVPALATSTMPVARQSCAIWPPAPSNVAGEP